MDPSRLIVIESLVRGKDLSLSSGRYYLVAAVSGQDAFSFIDFEGGEVRILDSNTLNEIFNNNSTSVYSNLRLGPSLPNRGRYSVNVVAENIVDYILPVGVGKEGFFKFGEVVRLNR